MHRRDYMSDEFKRFSRRIQLEYLIKAIIVSLSLGLISAGLPLLILKLLKIEIAAWIYVIIGLGVFILAMIGFYLFKPNESKIARRIDRELKLNEKVMTMVEYQNEDGFMLDIQRDDANNRLKDLPTKSLRLHFSFLYPVILIIALAISITSIALPVGAIEKPKEEEEDKDYDEDSYTIQRLKELIEYVKESNCNKEYKLRSVKSLEDLIPLIEKATVESEMKAAVEGTISKLKDDLIPSNSHKIIYNEALVKNKDANGIFFASLINELKPERIDTLITTIKNELEANLANGIATLTTARIDFKDKLETSTLKDSYGTDELYLAIVGFGRACGLGAQGLNDGSLELKDALLGIDLAQEELKKAMAMQECNNKTAEYLELELRVLFDLIIDEEDTPSTEPSLPDMSEPDDSTDTHKGDNEGGFGDGDILYGSDDVIYDPEFGYVKYGEILEKYRALIEKDVVEGALTPEMIEFYREYYRNLTQKEENNK